MISSSESVAATAAGSLGSRSASRTAQASARYQAPLSRKVQPSAAASFLAKVLLPDPDNPSRVMTRVP